MKIRVLRFSDNGNSSLGILLVDGVFNCYTLEDEDRADKIKHETRIPEGTYKIGIRAEGGFHQRYLKRFGDGHKGMIEILDVPNFEHILIHCGNTEAHTSGCLLVGDSVNNNMVKMGFLGESTSAYKRLYPKMMNALKSNEPVTISYEKLC